ncbi:MAG: recombinase family protein [Oscillospiraceae bacterium]|nr:recombinase family protein [Oscillospiraceae bacterium]
MVERHNKKVGIYVRLSKEDARMGESVSIENQKAMLIKHVKDNKHNGWILVDVYCDDGFSGTNQNRPALQKMFEDIRCGNINLVLIKDLSRLGRNYLEVGNFAEVFLPQHGCELVSLSEKMDEMMVFRNWFNEQHSRETSKKVKTVKRMCAQNGKFVGAYSPYGYAKSEDNKHLLVPDEIAAATVRRIFELRAEGLGHKAIAVRLNESGTLPPRDYYYSKKPANKSQALKRKNFEEIS